MKKKSKFLVFILSPIPGLSHLYLGWNKRALVFFMVFMGLCVGAMTLGNISYHTHNIIGPLVFFTIALVWFIALAEALSVANKKNILVDNEDETGSVNIEKEAFLFTSNRKMIALAFSTIPGAGHMYLGLLKQGAQLMTGFFFILLLADWLHLSLLSFLVPVIWFYSVFDIYHLLEEEEELQLDSSTLFDWFSTHPGLVGWGLIGLGVLVILQRIVGPELEALLNSTIRSYIETIFVALILMAGGTKLLLGSKVKEKTWGEKRTEASEEKLITERVDEERPEELREGEGE